MQKASISTRHPPMAMASMKLRSAIAADSRRHAREYRRTRIQAGRDSEACDEEKDQGRKASQDAGHRQPTWERSINFYHSFRSAAGSQAAPQHRYNNRTACLHSVASQAEVVSSSLFAEAGSKWCASIVPKDDLRRGKKPSDSPSGTTNRQLRAVRRAITRTIRVVSTPGGHAGDYRLASRQA